MPQTSLYDPENIAISKSKGIKIDWKDRHHSEYALRYLRDRCPCASCTGAHGPKPEPEAVPATPFQMFQPALKIEDIEPVGNYALRIKWNDGHSTGIYSYEHFRNICPCPECSGRS
jgi:DUF971 family protein